MRIGDAWTVEFTSDFQMLATEVTVAQYERRPAQSDDDRKPKVYVNWTDARDWCAALGSGWRLPSEVEWEYAARAGTETEWFFGDDESQLNEYAWYGEGFSSTGQHPVAQKKTSLWGLYDIYGNVWERTLDGYADDDAWAAAWQRFAGVDIIRDPLAHVDDSVNSLRVVRGGAFINSAGGTRSANRSRVDPRIEDWDVGFRCVRSSLPQPP